eukprot:592439_1
MSLLRQLDDLVKWIQSFDESRTVPVVDDHEHKCNDDDDADTIHWSCNKCTFVNTNCLYECEVCDSPNPRKQQYVEQKEECMPMSNLEILSKYLLNAQSINTKFINAFGQHTDMVYLAKCQISDDTKIDALTRLIENKPDQFAGIIFSNNNDTNIEVLADIVKKIRSLYKDLWIGVEFNFNYLHNNIRLMKKHQTIKNKQIIHNVNGMGFTIGCDEFVFQFLNDYNLTNLINGVFIKDAGIRVNYKNIASLRCIQRGEFERKHQKDDLIYFGGIQVGFNHSNQDCKHLAGILSKGYMDCVCFIVNQANIMDITNKLRIFKKEIQAKCKLCVVATSHDISWLVQNHKLAEMVDVVMCTFDN